MHSTHLWLALAILFGHQICPSSSDDNAKRLFDDLMSNYNHFRRPGHHKEVLRILMKMRLSQIIDVHEKTQIMTTSIWLKQTWTDPKLKWDPLTYGNTTVLYVPASLIWVPDIVLYNNADKNYNITIETKATLHFTGLVEWEPPAVFQSMCTINVLWFPFDEQICNMKFGSWSYSEDLLDLRHLDGPIVFEIDDDENGHPQNTSVVLNGVDLSDYYPSVEWEILENPAKRHGKTYPSCCPGSPAYIDITYYLHLRRKPLFYTVNLVFPCCGISFLTVLVFYLPARSCSKMNLCISILVSLTVFFLLLTEIIPATSLALPLIGKYLLFTMVMVTLSVMTTVVTINVHYRTPTTHRMPRWFKRLFLVHLPKLLYMQRPLMSHKSLREITMTDIRNKAQSAASRALWQRIGVDVGQDPAAAFTSRQASHESQGVRHRGADTHPPQQQAQQDYNLNPFASPAVKKSFENVRFISDMLKQKDKQDKIDEDWKYAAMVLDRLLLWIFSITAFFGSVIILLQAPSLRDNRPAIDERLAHAQSLDWL